MWYGVISPPAPWYRGRENMANAAGIEPAQQDLEFDSPALEHERPIKSGCARYAATTPVLYR